jgi:hypothetical protein
MPGLRRWLDPARHVCLPVMRRCQGLIVARGNPHKLQTLADVSRRGLRMVNRQRGSGTRSMIDQLLAANNLRPESIAGYNHEEFTHEAIAATVAAGQADVGFGIEAAAARYDLVSCRWSGNAMASPCRAALPRARKARHSWRACTATPSASACWRCPATSRCRRASRRLAGLFLRAAG